MNPGVTNFLSQNGARELFILKTEEQSSEEDTNIILLETGKTESMEPNFQQFFRLSWESDSVWKIGSLLVGHRAFINNC